MAGAAAERRASHGEDWTRCSEQREVIQHWLVEGLRLTKIRKLLAWQGVSIGYPTLYRFAVEQLQFGRAATKRSLICEEWIYLRSKAASVATVCVSTSWRGESTRAK